MPVIQGMRRSIKHSVTAAFAVGVAALVLAACGGSNDDGNATAASSGSGSGLVSTASVDGMNVLVDSQGKTLYSADVEKGGMIRCTDGCTSFWKPLDATAKQSKTASANLGVKFGMVKRPDGAQQLTFKGQPLYTFTEEGSGELQGDGFSDDFQGTHFVWSAATTAGGGSGSGESNGSSGDSGGYSSPY
jgi:predicted lipoprotein with Yx(FWY)xxD motif